MIGLYQFDFDVGRIYTSITWDVLLGYLLKKMSLHWSEASIP